VITTRNEVSERGIQKDAPFACHFGSIGCAAIRCHNRGDRRDGAAPGDVPGAGVALAMVGVDALAEDPGTEKKNVNS
jgi:predicted CxxxxCH...CXXCH cytochrome family protein